MADRRWIDVLTQIVHETWDEEHPSRPKTLGFMGSEEFIRLQFEEYLLALLSCMKYHEELNSIVSGGSPHRSRSQLQNFNIEGDPALDFNSEFLTLWQKTSNYALFSRLTSDALLFSITEPRHPSAGGLTMEDIQRRLTQQVADLHLDERVREGREALNRHLATGQKKVSAAFSNFWADIEAMREAQRKRNEERASQSQRTSIDQTPASPPPASIDSNSESPGTRLPTRQRPSLDVSQAQASVSIVSQKAGSYFSSWGTWASEKRREWQEKRTSSPTAHPGMTASPSTPTLSVVTETIDSDRGRRHSMQRHSEDAGGLSRSLSRRKRWSNKFLRRDSGEFIVAKLDESTDSTDTPFPKSPLSQGFPAYEPAVEERETNAEPSLQTEKPKPAEERPADADGFSSVPLSPEEETPVEPKKDEGVLPTATEEQANAAPTAGPVKDEAHADADVSKDSEESSNRK